MAKSSDALAVFCLLLIFQAFLGFCSTSEVKLQRSRLPKRRVRGKLQIQNELRKPRTRFVGIFREKFRASVALVDGDETAEELSKELSYETAWPRNGKRKLTIVKVLNHENAKKKRRERFPLHDIKDVPSFLKRHMYLRRNKREIFGRDNRFYIPTRSFAQRFPFSAVVKLSTGCTGALVSPRHVITAAHCVHTGKRYVNGFSTLKVGSLKRDGTFQWIDVSKASIPLAWVNGEDKTASKYDYTILKLAKKHRRPYLTITVSEGERHGRGDRIHFTAFEDDKPRNTIWYRFCRVEEDGQDMLYHFCDAKPGSSGAGVYTYHYDKRLRKWSRRIVGVFSGNRWVTYPSWWYMPPRNYNAATRITTLKFAQICGWIGPKHWPRECLDYVSESSFTKLSPTRMPKTTVRTATNETNGNFTESSTPTIKTTVKSRNSTVVTKVVATSNGATEIRTKAWQNGTRTSEAEPTPSTLLPTSPGMTTKTRKRERKRQKNKRKRTEKPNLKSKKAKHVVMPTTKPCSNKTTEQQPQAIITATSFNQNFTVNNSTTTRRDKKHKRNGKKLRRHKEQAKRLPIGPTPTNRPVKGKIL